MKTEIGIIFITIFLILGASFFLFTNQPSSLTGFAAESSLNDSYSDETAIATEETAMLAIDESEDIIQEFRDNSFSTVYLEDILIEAKESLEKGRYEEVLLYRDDIKNIKTIAFFLFDKINVDENKLAEASNTTKAIFEEARVAFSEERYNDTEKLLEDFNIALEKEKSESYTLAGIREGAKNFFQRYWINIIIFLIILCAAGYAAYKIFEKKLLINKIKKMKTEEQVLNGLIKKTQTQRFKENKIPELVYKIRMEKYQKRQQEIKEVLPIAEERLRRFKK